jgi:hypothetical protein
MEGFKPFYTGQKVVAETFSSVQMFAKPTKPYDDAVTEVVVSARNGAIIIVEVYKERDRTRDPSQKLPISELLWQSYA